MQIINGQLIRLTNQHATGIYRPALAYQLRELDGTLATGSYSRIGGADLDKGSRLVIGADRAWPAEYLVDAQPTTESSDELDGFDDRMIAKTARRPANKSEAYLAGWADADAQIRALAPHARIVAQSESRLWREMHG